MRKIEYVQPGWCFCTSAAMLKLPYQKMKSRINLNSLTSEEIDTLKDDGIGNNKHIQEVYNTAKKFFTILFSSKNPNILKYTVIVKDKSRDYTHFFREYFRGTPQTRKKNLNDLLKLFALRKKKVIK